jgi:hypothetical protein
VEFKWGKDTEKHGGKPNMKYKEKKRYNNLNCGKILLGTWEIGRGHFWMSAKYRTGAR